MDSLMMRFLEILLLAGSVASTDYVAVTTAGEDCASAGYQTIPDGPACVLAVQGLPTTTVIDEACAITATTFDGNALHAVTETIPVNQADRPAGCYIAVADSAVPPGVAYFNAAANGKTVCVDGTFRSVVCRKLAPSAIPAVVDPSASTNVPEASCLAHSQCVVAGLTGSCCPTTEGFELACCSAAEAEVATAGAEDPSGCAADIMETIAAITSASKFIAYAGRDCPGTNEQGKRKCGEDINAAVTDVAAASKSITGATETCGGRDESCAMDITNSITALSATSETLISAVTNCEQGSAHYDAFQCVINCFDAVDTLTHFSKSIYDAVESCGPAEPTAEEKCNKITAGQRQLVVENCEGHGCNANGDDQDCAWCVTDMSACSVPFGEAVCTAIKDARTAQNVQCSGLEDIFPAERRLLEV